MDSVQLDHINSSFLGESCIRDNHIFFIDEKFSYVYKFDMNGRYIGKYIGQGKGENELPIKSIQFFSPLQTGGFFFIGPSWDCFVYDSNFRRINDYGINWHYDVTKEAMLKKPDPAESELYSLLGNRLRIRINNDQVFLPIASQHPTFNPTNPQYAREARTLAQMDLQTGYIDKIFGRFSPAYSKNSNNSIFPYQFLALAPGNTFRVGFPPDSLIYITSADFDIQSAYGFAGREMDTAYRGVKNLDSFRNNNVHELKERGYYSSLEYIEERDLTFRSYQKSGHATSDGLQIYKGDTLVADLDIPKGFRVEGYNAPYFYSASIADEDKETIKLYRFKL